MRKIFIIIKTLERYPLNILLLPADPYHLTFPDQVLVIIYKCIIHVSIKNSVLSPHNQSKMNYLNSQYVHRIRIFLILPTVVLFPIYWTFKSRRVRTKPYQRRAYTYSQYWQNVPQTEKETKWPKQVLSVLILISYLIWLYKKINLNFLFSWFIPTMKPNN